MERDQSTGRKDPFPRPAADPAPLSPEVLYQQIQDKGWTELDINDRLLELLAEGL